MRPFSLRRIVLWLAWLAFLAGMPGICRADDVDLQGLIQRLERIEKQNQDLQQRLDQQQQTIQQQQQQLQALSTPPVAAPSNPSKEGTIVPVQALGNDEGGNPVILNPSPNPGGGGIAPGSFPYGRNAPPVRPGYFAGWSEVDDFFLRSPDENFLMRLTGQIQTDFRAYNTQHDTTDLDSFLVRRARLGVEGEVFKFWEYRFLPDFSNSQGTTSDVAAPRILDAYVNAHYWDAFQVEAGKFKQPFSYEQLVQDRFIPTVERSLIDQLVPARDIGVMVHGEKLLDDKLDYAFSVFNGEINDDYDQNNSKDLAGRLVIRPLNWEALPECLRGLQLGVSYSWGRDNESISNTTPNTIRTPDQVPFLVLAAGVREDGVRTRFSPEIVYFYKQFGLAAQYYYGEQQFLPSSTAPHTVGVTQNGFYVLSSFVLTGETRTTYSQMVIPFHNFDAKHPFANPGAWELLARVSALRYGDELFDTYKMGNTTYGPLANSALYSQGATEFDVGFNWFLNKYIRVELAYEHDWFLEPVELGSGSSGHLDHQDSIITRLQIAF